MGVFLLRPRLRRDACRAGLSPPTTSARSSPRPLLSLGEGARKCQARSFLLPSGGSGVELMLDADGGVPELSVASFQQELRSLLSHWPLATGNSLAGCLLFTDAPPLQCNFRPVVLSLPS